MKVAIVTNLIPDYQQSFFNKLVELYQDLELTVFADIDSKNTLNQYSQKMANFNVINSPMKEVNGLIFRKSIFNELKNNFDKIIIYANPREVSLSILMIRLRASGITFYTHGMFHRVGGAKMYSKLYYQFAAFLSDKVFVYSRKGAEVLSNLNVDYRKVRVIGTAIDQNCCIDKANSISKEDIHNFKIENDLTGKKIVLQVVRLSKIKKPELTIEAAKILRDVHPDILFVLIGGGDLFDSIKNRVKELGLEANVRLLGPIYDEDLLAFWFSAASVFVMPTCIGLSAHHAFSYALPIVTDDDFLNQASEFDILSDGLNSLLYQNGSTQDFAMKILKVIGDSDFRLFLSANALRTVKMRHSIESKVHAYYCSLIN